MNSLAITAIAIGYSYNISLAFLLLPVLKVRELGR